MKIQKILALAAFMPMTASQASTVGDTTVVIENPQKVIINETAHDVSVKVEGKKDNANYRYNYNAALGKEKTFSVIETDDIGNLVFPFQKSSFGSTFPSFVLGFSNAVNGETGVETNFGSGLEIGFYVAEIEAPKLNNHWMLAMNFGFLWRNYRMTGGNRFLKTDNSVAVTSYPDGSDIQFSRIKTFSLQLPIMLMWQTKVPHYRFSACFGPILSWNTYGSLKTRYELNGKKHKEFSKNVHQVPFSMDLFGNISCNDIGVYVRWSPFNVLKTDSGPRFNSLSCGISVDL